MPSSSIAHAQSTRCNGNPSLAQQPATSGASAGNSSINRAPFAAPATDHRNTGACDESKLIAATADCLSSRIPLRYGPTNVPSTSTRTATRSRLFPIQVFPVRRPRSASVDCVRLLSCRGANGASATGALHPMPPSTRLCLVLTLFSRLCKLRAVPASVDHLYFEVSSSGSTSSREPRHDACTARTICLSR